MKKNKIFVACDTSNLKKIIIVGQSMGAEVSVLSSIKNKNIIDEE